jgi:murein DD-endopeptidase MepM/ murein hydrolase activator NlpD
MKYKYLFRVMSLLVLIISFLPVSRADALTPTPTPLADMFQLPWDQGIAWVAIDGLDNGSKRPLTSSHNYKVGGAIDFAPHNNMVKGEDTSNFWVAAAGSGTVVGVSSCHVIIAHASGWITQYQFLAKIQVKLGDAVNRNQRLGIIADGVKYKFCLGSEEPNVPHVHFILRPSLTGATFAGWVVGYNSSSNITTFTKNGQTLGLFKPLLNVFDATPTPTATQTLTQTATATLGSETPSATPTPTQVISPTPTLSGPYVSTVIDAGSIAVGESTLVTVSLNNVPAEGYTSAEFTCTYNINLFEVNNITATNLFGADAVVAINGPQTNSFILAIAGSQGNKATTSGTVFTFNIKGLQAGQTVIECRARISTGNNVLTEIPFAVDYITVLGSTPTLDLTPSATPTVTGTPASLTPTVTESGSTQTLTPSATPSGPTATSTATPAGDWLVFTNSKYGFQFQYPPQGQIVAGGNDNFTRINLPFAPGTNLGEKYLQVDVVENANPCRSPVAASSIVQSSETVTLNGITFLKETGQEPAAGNLYQFVAYSTFRDNVCVSLSFVLHSVNPGNFSTPIPVFDYAAESAVFGQIVSTYNLIETATPTPTGSPAPAESETPTSTPTPGSFPTPFESPTVTSTLSSSPTPSGNNGAVAGQITTSKPVTVNIYDANNTLVATMETTPDGRFRLEVAPGTYTVVASEPGFLRAEGTVTLTTGNTIILPPLTLLAGDIDGNNVIDQFDALTIGMNYNTNIPEAADLNGDGTINVLDLELLAKNYRKTGPVNWE